MTSLDFSVFLAVFFFIILLFGGRKYRVHSFIIALSSSLNVLFQLPLADSVESYVYNRNVGILWDGATAFILTMFLVFDKVAWKQASLLAFACFCHVMIVYDMTVSSTWFSLFFFNYYNELIVGVGVAQMAASYDGIITALGSIWWYLRRSNIYTWCSSSGNSLFENGACQKCEAK